MSNFLKQLSPILDGYLSKCDNYLLIGNTQIPEPALNEFCETYYLENLINEPTCYNNPSIIDVMLTNRPKRFRASQTIETGLSDHKWTVTVLKMFFQKQNPISLKYRDYKKFDQTKFRKQLEDELNAAEITNEKFESIFITLLEMHAPTKEKIVRANDAPFMNKTLSKAVMTRTRLRNKFVRNPTKGSTLQKHQHYCVSLFKKEKKRFYNNIDIKSLMDNRLFWKTPLFRKKYTLAKMITLLENDKIITTIVTLPKL